MTKQYLHTVAPTVDIELCRKKCVYYHSNSLFDLCAHKKSEYKVGLDTDHHTCQHMRQDHEPCGSSAVLLTPR